MTTSAQHMHEAAPDRDLRIAFAGVTHLHAAAWARAVQRAPGMRISAVHDSDEQVAGRFRDQFGGQLIELDELARAADLVLVDGRNNQNADLASTAISMGLPTLIEKPGGMTAADVAAIAATAQRHGVATHVGYFLRYADPVQEARALLADGALGTLTLARFHCGLPGRVWQNAAWFPRPDSVVGGFTEAGCHMVDIMRALLGEPDEVLALSVPSADRGNHAEGAVAAALRFGSAACTLDFTAHEINDWYSSWAFELYGTTASYRGHVIPASGGLTAGGRGWEADPPRGIDEDDLSDKAAAEDEALMSRSLTDFGRALRTPGRTSTDAASGARTLALIERILAQPPSTSTTD